MHILMKNEQINFDLEQVLFFFTSCWLSIKVLHSKTVEIFCVFINQKYSNIEQHFLSLMHYKRIEKQIF